jgi:hypothetical protein
MEAVNGTGMRAVVSATMTIIKKKFSESRGITAYSLVTLVERGRVQYFEHVFCL